MSAHTVVFQHPKTGAIVIETVLDQKTGEEAAAEVRDIAVILGFTGSVVLHQSKNIGLKRVEPTQAELEAAFELVRPPGHWKDPIDKTLKGITGKKQAMIHSAIVHFTGSVPTFEALPGKRLRVRADGYYAAVGA